MDSVSSKSLALWLASHGGMAVIQRFQPIENQVDIVRAVVNDPYSIPCVGAAVAVNGDAKERTAELVHAGVNLLVMDVAHGHSWSVLHRISEIKHAYPDVLVTSGNITTVDAARDSIGSGADMLRTGVGSGSACTTRSQIGIGRNLVDSIKEIYGELGSTFPVIADGGIRRPGDVTKALAAGASAVMAGQLFARYPIAALPGKHRGMASDAVLSQRDGVGKYATEGRELDVEVVEDYENDFAQFILGVKAGFAYLGARNIEDLRKRAIWEKQ